MDRRNPTTFAIVEGVGWGLLIMHVLPEIVVDMNTFPGRSRRLAHLRYGPTPWSNLGQSLVFAAAGIFQGYYYVTIWYKDDDGDGQGDETTPNNNTPTNIMNLIAGHFWLVSGVLAASSLGFRCGCCGTTQRLGRGEQFLNDLYILTAISLCFIAYLAVFVPDAMLSVLQKYNIPEDLDFLWHFAIRTIWTLMGFAYVTEDIINVVNTKTRKDSPDSPQGARTPLRELT